MKKVFTSILLAITLFAGFFLLNEPAVADVDLQELLSAAGIPNPLPTEHGNCWARLDRGQLVYGEPSHVPSNDWKMVPPDHDGLDWQGANGIDLGRPGQEPRYLGFTVQGDPFSNDWFPIDAPNQIAPAIHHLAVLQPLGKYRPVLW